MKKIYTSCKLKVNSKAKQRRFNARSNKTYKKNRLNRLLFCKQRLKKLFWEKKIIDLKAPSNFSFINNTKDLLHFFNKCYIYIEKKQPIRINMKEVIFLTPDAIAIFVAKLESWREYKCPIMGLMPKKEELNRLLALSGFYDYVKGGGKIQADDMLLYKQTNNKVEPTLAKDACRKGLLHEGKINNCSDLYEILIECMANTNNHANLTHTGFYNWWLYVHKESNISSYVFLDLGVGIFESKFIKQEKKIFLF